MSSHKDMPDYEWSRYKGYLAYTKKWEWLHKDYIISMITKRGIFNEPRNIAVYLWRQIRGENLNNIGEQFNIKAYSTVSSILRIALRLKNMTAKLKNG